MKYLFRVGMYLLLSMLILLSTIGQKAAKADLSEEEAAEEMCATLALEISLSAGGYLTSRDPGSRINIRAGAGTRYPVRHQAVSGDAIANPLELEAVSDGYCWLKVRLIRSGVVGWVRSDFVNLNIAPSN
jgi:uncharacterized protein YraI